MDETLLFNKAHLIESDEIAFEDVPFLSTRVEGRALRKLADETLRSGLLTLPEGWSSQKPQRVSAAIQVFVRRGALQIDGRLLGADAFVVLPTNGVMPVITAEAESEILVIQDEGQKYTPVISGNDALVTANVFDIEPIVPVIAGRRLTGFERRVLWLDPDSGGDTRLLRIPAGFSGAGPSWHPVNEEIFCLDGEICPSRDRTLKAGSYLWNPARSVHGYHEMTVPGCVLLEWHDGPWDLIKYEDPADGG